MNERVTASKVPPKIVRGAEILMDIFENVGPGPKTGLSGEIALKLDKSVSPREFADMVQYCRRVLGPRRGKAVVWNRATQQYGFPENIEVAECYVILWNNRYLATRAETMADTCGAAIAQHGHSYALARSKLTHQNYAQSLRFEEEQYVTETAAERWAKRTGADAPMQLEERVG